MFCLSTKQKNTTSEDLERIHKMDVIANVITALIIGVVITPIVQSQYAIPALTCAFLFAISDMMDVCAIAFWEKHHIEIVKSIRKYHTVGILFECLACCVIIFTNSAKYYLAMSLTTMFINYLMNRYCGYVKSQLYWDHNVGLYFGNKKEKIINIYHVVSSVGAIILIKTVPSEHILRICASGMLVLTVFDAFYSVMRITFIEGYLSENPAPTQKIG